MRFVALAVTLIGLCPLAYSQSYNDQLSLPGRQYYPSWWINSSPPVTNVTTPEGNFAMANLGQLKYFATQAKSHLDTALADVGGAGPDITNLVASFKPVTGVSYTPAELAQISADNYSAVTIGQMKAVAKLFYDRLIAVGYDTTENIKANGYPYDWGGIYPWNANTPVTENYFPVNVGQLKLAFSFDVVDSDSNGVLDFQEGIYPARNPQRDTDLDGLVDDVDPDPNIPVPLPPPPTNNALANYYVSATGSVSGDGSLNNPFPSIQAARDAIRLTSRVSPAGHVVVNILEGDYYVSSPIEFASGDSGVGSYYIIYRAMNSTGTAFAAGKVRIHSGALVQNWTSLGGNVYQGSLTGSQFTGVNMTTLAGETRYIVDSSSASNQKFGWLARYPNQNGGIPHNSGNTRLTRGDYSSTIGGSRTGTDIVLQFNSSFLSNKLQTMKDSLADSPAASAPFWGPENVTGDSSEWAMLAFPITSINVGSNFHLQLLNDPVQEEYHNGGDKFTPGSGDRFFVEGFETLLDDPGEFFLDKTGATIKYVSDSTPTYVRVPVSSTLIKFNGAANIMFQGVEFAFTKGGDAPLNPDAAIELRANSTNIWLDACNIHHVAEAVNLTPGTKGSRFTNCWIHECAVSGIVMKGSKGDNTTNNTVDKCVFENMGCLYTDSIKTAAVLLQSTKNCNVYNSRIFNSTRYGISVRGNIDEGTDANGNIIPVRNNDKATSDGNNVASIWMQYCGSDSGDCAALHVVGVNMDTDSGAPKNTFTDVYIQNTYQGSIAGDVGPWGVYIDHPGGALKQKFSFIKSTNADNDGRGFIANGSTNQTSQITQNVTWESRNQNQIDTMNNHVNTRIVPAAASTVGLFPAIPRQ